MSKLTDIQNEFIRHLKDPTQCELLVETVCCVVFFISAKP